MKPMKVMRGSGSYRYKLQKRKRNRKIALTLIAVLVVLAVAIFVVVRLASRPAQPEPENALPVSQPAAAVMNNGEAAQLDMKVGELSILAVPQDVDLRAVVFESDNSGVAIVDPAGCVKAVGEGKAGVTVTGFGFKSKCEVNVSAAEASAVSDELTTAITANADIVAKNSRNGTDNLYNITVNRRTNVVTVYTYDERGEYTVPVRAMVASCGEGGDNETPTGEYLTYFREAWHPLYGDVYGMYVTGIDGPYLFHSVPYHTENHDDLETEEFNKLGTNASMGCVRLMASDVRWIFKNCPLNMPVAIIDADESADPLGKPLTVKIDESIGWDPTDPNGENPYKGKKPEITGVQDVTMKKGESLDIIHGVAAKDICGNDITSSVIVTGNVLTEKPGVYFLSYKVTDAFRLSTTVVCTVTVTE